MSKNYNFSFNIFWNIFTKIIILFIKTGSSIITARLLGPYERGIYYAIIQSVGFINTIITLSIGEGIIYNLSNRKNYISIFGNIIIFIVFFTSISFSLLFIYEDSLRSYILKDIPSNLFYFVFLLSPFLMFEYFCSFTLRGMKLFTLSNKLSILSKSTLLVFLCVGFYFFGADIEICLTFLSLSYFIICLIYGFLILKISNFNLIFNFKKILNIIFFSSKIHLNNLLNEIEYRFDIFIILFFVDYTALGIYSVGVALAQLVWYVSNSINSVLYPYLVANDKNNNEFSFTDNVIKYNFVINIYLLVTICLLGHFIVQILYGFDYLNSFYIFLILAPGLLFDSITRNIFVWIKSKKNPFLLSKISFVTLLINLALNFILIPIYGIYGAAISSSISYIFRSFIAMIIYKKNRKDLFKKISILNIMSSFRFISVDIVRRVLKIAYKKI